MLKVLVVVAHFPALMDYAFPQKAMTTSVFVPVLLTPVKIVKMVSFPKISKYFLRTYKCYILVPLVERLKHYLWQDNWYEKYTTSNGNSPLWKYINKLPFLCKYYNKKIYNLRNYVMEDNFVYSSAEENQLELAAGRSLAATPVDCPTPMGLKGKWKNEFTKFAHS